VAFKDVPKECLGGGLEELLDECKGGKAEACRTICDLGWIGEPEEFGAI
jgi:hypothetical protein